ncbi:hypothetical protein WICMUC_002966 [Wickerhamomyces mucosus]|uniref:Uncharacterized protein n=1 Tax=Wickerhamomyces mucosus TaxID=1378264 RepID=A0A9P8PM97_9ASCO|nr:hypothetical protein WICMUC_002966 [Wickerhamomyces mucosus]
MQHYEVVDIDNSDLSLSEAFSSPSLPPQASKEQPSSLTLPERSISGYKSLPSSSPPPTPTPTPSINLNSSTSSPLPVTLPVVKRRLTRSSNTLKAEVPKHKLMNVKDIYIENFEELSFFDQWLNEVYITLIVYGEQGSIPGSAKPVNTAFDLKFGRKLINHIKSRGFRSFAYFNKGARTLLHELCAFVDKKIRLSLLEIHETNLERFGLGKERQVKLNSLKEKNGSSSDRSRKVKLGKMRLQVVKTEKRAKNPELRKRSNLSKEKRRLLKLESKLSCTRLRKSEVPNILQVEEFTQKFLIAFNEVIYQYKELNESVPPYLIRKFIENATMNSPYDQIVIMDDNLTNRDAYHLANHFKEACLKLYNRQYKEEQRELEKLENLYARQLRNMKKIEERDKDMILLFPDSFENIAGLDTDSIDIKI